MKRFSILLFLITSCTSWTQMMPNAPIKNFMVPGFSQEGYTEWILKGRELEYKSEDLAFVQDMYLQILSPNDSQELTMEMRSPHAFFLLKNNKAKSKESIEIRGPNFQITGRQWKWDGTQATKKIIIEKEGSVVFYEELKGFLK